MSKNICMCKNTEKSDSTSVNRKRTGNGRHVGRGMLLCLTAYIMLISVFSGATAVYAGEGSVGASAIEKSEGSDTASGNKETDPDVFSGGETTQEYVGTDNDVSDGNASQKEENSGTGETVSSEIMGFFSSHIGEVFCALTMLSSLVVAFLYKKGLLPAVASALGRINGTTASAVEKLGIFAESTDESIANMSLEVRQALKTVNEFIARAEKTAKANEDMAKELDALSSESEKMKKITAAQCDMIYTAFMSSGLPQYQKDNIGETYRKIKAASGESSEL